MRRELALALLCWCVVAARVSAALVDDPFDGTRLDRGKWADISQSGQISQSAELIASTIGGQTYSKAAVLTQYRISGDFDVQADFRIGNGWSDPIADNVSFPHTEIALAAYLDDSQLVQVARSKNPGGDFITVYTNIVGQESHNSVAVATAATSGRLRLIRTASSIVIQYQLAGTWQTLDTVPAFAAPTHVFLGATSVGIDRVFTAYFDNFLLNAGTASYRPYTRPATFLRRGDLAVGGTTADWLAIQTWGPDWNQVHPLDVLVRNGMQWLRAGVLTTSSTYLSTTPVNQWSTLPYRNEYWSSREYTLEMMRQAAARGMHLNLFFFLSDKAADASVQDAPAAWAGLSVTDTATQLDAYAYDATRYFMDAGVNVEWYDIGNEIDTGILNFRPFERITVPGGVDITMNIGWMRANVWNVEATLLKSAIAGVKRANPAAKIVLHIAGSSGKTNLFAEGFFQAMVDEGVPFDYAGVSLPNASHPWDLDQYTTVEWFTRLQELTDFIGSLNKKLVLDEPNYPNTSVGPVATPMTEFPFTPSGQAAWIREQLRFASHDPNVTGWFYWYPDGFTGINGGAQPAGNTAVGLFASELQVQPGMHEFLVNAPFTDSVLTTGSTVVKAAHFLELRSHIDALRARYPLAAFNWTTPTLTPASTIIALAHVADLRSALADVYTSAGLTPPSYTDPSVPAGTPIKAVHIDELRAAVRAIE